MTWYQEGRIPLSFTFITYPADDLLGELLAWISFVPMVFFVIQTTLVLVDAHSMEDKKTAFLVFFGQLANEFISYRLKDVFEELRPNATERFDYGMPSSHAQFMGFLMAIFDSLIQFTVFKYLPRWLAYLLGFAGSALVGYARVYLGYHSIRQVVVGFFLGMTLGSIWALVLASSTCKQKLKTN